MAEYRNIQHLKRGVKRENGHGWTCMWETCMRPATVKARRVEPMILEVRYCVPHAEMVGITVKT